jgi:hypothetical protein
MALVTTLMAAPLLALVQPELKPAAGPRQALAHPAAAL